jgi:hypothetical protein
LVQQHVLPVLEPRLLVVDGERIEVGRRSGRVF